MALSSPQHATMDNYFAPRKMARLSERGSRVGHLRTLRIKELTTAYAKVSGYFARLPLEVSAWVATARIACGAGVGCKRVGRDGEDGRSVAWRWIGFFMPHSPGPVRRCWSRCSATARPANWELSRRPAPTSSSLASQTGLPVTTSDTFPVPRVSNPTSGAGVLGSGLGHAAFFGRGAASRPRLGLFPLPPHRGGLPGKGHHARSEGAGAPSPAPPRRPQGAYRLTALLPATPPSGAGKARAMSRSTIS